MKPSMLCECGYAYDAGRFLECPQKFNHKPNTIEWVAVKSSRIAAIRYDVIDLMLYVRFANGRVYRYTNVSPSLYADLAGADSIGTEFQTAVVRNKNLTVNEITNEEEAI